jgi:hypothetical protein
MQFLCDKKTRYVRLNSSTDTLADLTVLFDVVLTDEDLEELVPSDEEARKSAVEEIFGADDVKEIEDIDSDTTFVDDVKKPKRRGKR